MLQSVPRQKFRPQSSQRSGSAGGEGKSTALQEASIVPFRATATAERPLSYLKLRIRAQTSPAVGTMACACFLMVFMMPDTQLKKEIVLHGGQGPACECSESDSPMWVGLSDSEHWY